MDAIILFSHGSLLCGAGGALEDHAARLRALNLAGIVEIGYLNYSEPLFLQTVAKCLEAGATRIIVTPYFLVPGYFVKVDLPKCLQAAREAYPKLEFVVADAIGFDDRLADALIRSARTAAPPAFWRADLKRAALSCRSNPQCPLYGTSNCPGGGKREEREGKREKGKECRAEEVGGGAGEPSFRPEGGAGEGNISDNFSLFPFPSALLIMVHGSPRPIANEEMFRVVEKIKAQGSFPIVEVGFMECNTPTIPEAIEKCVVQGARSILAVPYFLHTGTHVAEDLPTLLEEGMAHYPQITFRMGDYLGHSEVLTEILAQRACAVL